MTSTHQSDAEPPVGGVEPQISRIVLVDAVQYHPSELILVSATNQITDLHQPIKSQVCVNQPITT